VPFVTFVVKTFESVDGKTARYQGVHRLAELLSCISPTQTREEPLFDFAVNAFK
jgi:hypothetical protein